MESRAGGERSRAGRPTATEAARLTERLRRAAVDTFLESGYDGTTMEAVAQAAGITKSTLYARYPDKRTLFIAVSSWALTRQERDERVLEPLPDDLAESLTVIARAILARSVDPDIVRLSRMAIAESARFPEFAASSQAVTWSPRVQLIIDLLRRHESAGTVVVGDVDLAAEQFFAMVGAMPAWLAAYGIYRTPEVEEEHLHHAVSLFLNGVLARPETMPDPHPTEAARPTEAAEAARPAGEGPAVPRASWPMEYRRLGRSGLNVSRLALGVAALGAGPAGHDERAAIGVIHRFLDAGGSLLDTTAAGDIGRGGTDPDGAAAELCGRAVRDRRSSVVLASSVGRPSGQGPHDGGNSRRHIRAACEATLRRLRTDYLDLLQLDADDPTTPLEETIDALDDLVRAGKVLYVGVANLHVYRVMKALSVSDRLGRARFISFRGPYGLLSRELEHEHLPLLAEEGLGLISTSSLRSHGHGHGHAAVAATEATAAELGCTTTQLSLAWQLTRPVTSITLDVASAAQLDEHLAALGIEIPTEIAAALEQVSRPQG
ncbi:putative transcriptional regulator, TetR family [Parafrankia sp. Ea1.12]|uniref:aldo/keto reductase n=1 Tax=Parafrankia sp. Ea1.12 TaxID=573499 RepID=UPI000DA4EA04|nr:aldo/keto reductase [Parafrankia sp. Ea1.12]SQD95207.1 putative transcriptional regulator, TetR family [Parafrankia sp. Ea1.12]